MTCLLADGEKIELPISRFPYDKVGGVWGTCLYRLNSFLAIGFGGVALAAEDILPIAGKQAEIKLIVIAFIDLIFREIHSDLH